MKLDRDRRMLRSFDTQWITKEMWGEVSKQDDMVDSIANGVVNKSKSLQYIHHAHIFDDKEVSDKLLGVYKEKYDGKILVDSCEEKDALTREGYLNVEYINNEAFVSILKSNDEYKEILLNAEMEKPLELLDNFKDKWYDNMSTGMLYEFEDLCTKLSKILK